jgi:hypothetical protein
MPLNSRHVSHRDLQVQLPPQTFISLKKRPSDKKLFRSQLYSKFTTEDKPQSKLTLQTPEKKPATSKSPSTEKKKRSVNLFKRRAGGIPSMKMFKLNRKRTLSMGNMKQEILVDAEIWVERIQVLFAKYYFNRDLSQAINGSSRSSSHPQRHAVRHRDQLN